MPIAIWRVLGFKKTLFGQFVSIVCQGPYPDKKSVPREYDKSTANRKTFTSKQLIFFEVI